MAEDQPLNQRVVQVILERLGHQLHVVSTGIAAVEAASDGQYDAILMDMHMPGGVSGAVTAGR